MCDLYLLCWFPHHLFFHRTLQPGFQFHQNGTLDYLESFREEMEMAHTAFKKLCREAESRNVTVVGAKKLPELLLYMSMRMVH